MSVKEYKSFVGIDVSKGWLDGWIRPRGESLRVKNETGGYAEIVAKLETLDQPLLVVEGTGGYERGLVEAVQAAGQSVSVANAYRIKSFMRGVGQSAKTDALDAAGIAHYAEVVNPPECALTPESRQIRQYVQRREVLSEFRKTEKQRLRQITDSVIRASIENMIKTFTAEIKAIEKATHAFIDRNENTKAKSRVMQRQPGVGPVVSATLIAQCPELGLLDRRAIASLVGLAPFARDSGRFSGERHIFGGRKRIRNLLFVATMSATRTSGWLQDHYRALLARGKRKKVALIACARKLLVRLNAMIRDEVVFQLPSES